MASSDGEYRWLSRQGGAHVSCFDDCLVTKEGSRVLKGEEVALQLVAQHTSAPVPRVIFSNYKPDNGSISMTFVPGQQLQIIWHTLDEVSKEQVCRNTWSMIYQWRNIPRPSNLENLFQCLADGSAATRDPLLQDLVVPPRPLPDDESLRARIYQRYFRCGGRRYEKELPDMLPRSSSSVFTHADIAPHNIMVDDRGQITGIIDWEMAGWYPDYSEYANIMKPTSEEDWREWMKRTAPHSWDLSGLDAARRVLF